MRTRGEDKERNIFPQNDTMVNFQVQQDETETEHGVSNMIIRTLALHSFVTLAIVTTNVDRTSKTSMTCA